MNNLPSAAVRNAPTMQAGARMGKAGRGRDTRASSTQPSTGSIAEILDAIANANNPVIVGLDNTGVTKAPLPALLDSPDIALESSKFWTSAMDTPLDAIHSGDLEVVVASFLVAVDTGYATCSVAAANDDRVMLRFWNLLDEHNVMVVLTELASDEQSEISIDPVDAPLPLLLVQTATVHGLIDSIDDATRQVLGWGDEVIGQSRMSFQDPLTNEDSAQIWTNVLANPSRSFRSRMRLKAASGEWRWFDATTHNRLATDGVIVIEHIDITEHMADQPSVDPTHVLADYLAGLAPDGVICLDETGTVLAANDRFAQLTRMEVDPITRHLLPAPHVVGEPFQRVVRSALAGRGPQTHTAFVSHAQHRLRFTATLIPLTLHRRCCAVLVDENLSGDGRGALPKGLAPATLERVVATLAAASTSKSVPMLAEEAGLSPVSIRRYLSFLVQTGEVVVHRSYGTRGRPSQTYSLAP